MRESNVYKYYIEWAEELILKPEIRSSLYEYENKPIDKRLNSNNNAGTSDKRKQ